MFLHSSPHHDPEHFLALSPSGCIKDSLADQLRLVPAQQRNRIKLDPVTNPEVWNPAPPDQLVKAHFAQAEQSLDLRGGEGVALMLAENVWNGLILGLHRPALAT